MLYYAKRIYDSAKLGLRPGANLANYMRALDRLNEIEARDGY